MRKFIFLIGSMDDFESIEDLKACYFSGDHHFGDYNASVFPVEIDPATRITGYDTIEEIATMIGRAEAFSNSWCMDDTLSCLLES
jgi:hypothetical protein